MQTDPPVVIPAPFEPADEAALRRAVETLEFPGLFVKAANALGSPVEKLTRSLPTPIEEGLHQAVETTLRRAARIAQAGLGRRWRILDGRWAHRVEGVLTGAAGGAFGLPGLAAELPVTTTLILRSIMAVAQEHGEDLATPEAVGECLKVFAFGGPGRDKGADSAYFATRAAIPRVASRVSEIIPRIAARYAPAVGEKLAAQAAPVVGAVGGATLNLAFIAHFQSVAAAHFTFRALERKHGEGAVQSRYLAVLDAIRRDRG